ncbi:alpha-mannosidase [Leifsonia aquatica]|uniref:alpha-mannosidase n=1 Tax=Leifsonia aquatica TaxID=144185 RepID=UPI0028ADA618|nr:glycoside hydrolase family 38 C-terminal domain-containing protein [Leifsonia aquatica]
MHNDSVRVLGRLRRFRQEFLADSVYADAENLDVEAWEVPDEPVAFEDAILADYEPFELGSAYGKPWGTTWFRLRGDLPKSWQAEGVRAEVVIDLGFGSTNAGFQCEGTVYSPDGSIIKAVENYNRYVPLPSDTEQVDLLVEAASNPDVTALGFTRPTPVGDKATAGKEPLYVFRSAELKLLNVEVWELEQDLRVLSELHDLLPATLPRRAVILRAIEDALDLVDVDDIAGTARSARQALANALGAPAYASAHELYAVGHAHIDSAWLWPTRETVRKVARTFSNVLHLMDIDPDFVFAASSAQQYAWLKEHYPHLFGRVRERVHEGRFIPTGGMWVESDTNMVGGEALIRQFLEGKAFFLEEFGLESTEVWLPDTFGFTGAFPQIARLVGSPRLLTQKLSWNDTNIMPHHSFQWRGIDGSAIFTHFPPADTYNSDLRGSELAKAERQFKESGRANRSLIPYGYGDGGGGPTREMLATVHRTRDLEASPRVRFASPQQFFDAAEAEYAQPPTWSGELYLELHRGVLTSQHRTKVGNRRSEHLLHATELWATTATVRKGVPYPYEQLKRIWRMVLLQQFHDILPGSSIGWVHREAERHYAAIETELLDLIYSSLSALTGPGDRNLLANGSPFAVDSVASGAISSTGEPAGGRLSLKETPDGVVLENDQLRLVIDRRGFLVSVFDKHKQREIIPRDQPANVLTVYRDIPNDWDAWDIDPHYRRNGQVVVNVESLETFATEGRVGVRIHRRWGASSFTQTLELSPSSRDIDLVTDIDWRERRKLLKLAFPVRVHAQAASSEIQFGYINRPINTNTSWDAARYETVAHRWVHVGEPDYGVALANDTTYGHSISQTDDDGEITLIEQTLLRSPMMPDPEADQGEHSIRSTLVVDASLTRAYEAGYRLNAPRFEFDGGADVAPLLEVVGQGVLLETVKLAQDESGDVIARIYESLGNRATARVRPAFGATTVTVTDALERPIESAIQLGRETTEIEFQLHPFEIRTLRIRTR